MWQVGRVIYEMERSAASHGIENPNDIETIHRLQKVFICVCVRVCVVCVCVREREREREGAGRALVLDNCLTEESICCYPSRPASLRRATCGRMVA